MSESGLELLHEIAATLAARGPIEHSTMFGRPGLRTGKKIVMFLGADDRLMLKLPLARVNALVEEGVVERVTIGTRTMREWVEIPSQADADETFESWMAFAAESFDYVRMLAAER